jgi:hypothetical protein
VLPKGLIHIRDTIQAQANLLLSKTLLLKGSDDQGLQTFLQDVAGFFVIEHVIVQVAVNFRSQADLDNLWDDVTAKVGKAIADSLRECSDTAIFGQIKQSLMVFMQTLEVSI